MLQWHKQEDTAMDKKYVEELRNKYIQNPPEGMTPKDIQYMNDDDLLDMDHFLHEDDDLDDGFDDDEFGQEGFYLFWPWSFVSYAHLPGWVFYYLFMKPRNFL